jgi:hypothetical protein
LLPRQASKMQALDACSKLHSHFMRTLRGYLRLSAFERRIALQSFLGLFITRAGLSLVGFRRWKIAVARLTPVHGTTCEAGMRVSVCGTIVRMQAAAERRLFFKASCLEHALVLWWLLRRHGIPAEVRIGGRKEQGRFEAHAWVEIDGVPLGDANGAHREFVPLDGPTTLMESRSR